MSGLRPFFPYFGSKWLAARAYPPPVHRQIVEPFAGGAGYALRYPDYDVLLVERDPVVASIWRWLLTVAPESLRALPDVPHGANLYDQEFALLSSVERAFIGFHLGAGEVRPRHQWSSWWAKHNRGWSAERRAMLAAQLHRVRHWRVAEGDYTEAAQLVHGQATWFIDPPYIGKAGAKYRGPRVDYAQLAAWVRERVGQVIVCEAGGARWLPFREIWTTTGVCGKSREAVFVRYSAAA
jgi:hypothetical protein